MELYICDPGKNKKCKKTKCGKQCTRTKHAEYAKGGTTNTGLYLEGESGTEVVFPPKRTREEVIKELRMIADDLGRGCDGFEWLTGFDLKSAYKYVDG